MKILVLTNLFPPQYIGGYELICQTVVETLRERGHDLCILTSNYAADSASAQWDQAGAEPAVERVLKLNGLYGQPWHGLLELRWIEKHNNEKLRSTLNRLKPDLVYVWNMGGLSKSMLFTLQARGVPTVFYLSDHWIKRGLETDVWLRWWNQKGASRSRRILRYCCNIAGVRKRWQSLAPTNPPHHLRFERIYFCSRVLRDSTAAAGYDVSHGAVIYCPVHLRYFQSEPRPLDPGLRRLLYVGRLAEDKGVMTALRALARLGRKFQGCLKIYGRGEASYVAQLITFARDNQLDVTVTSAELEQMPQVYQDHDLLLFTSEWEEPFALTPIEAMASGLPVIGTTTGGSAELFRHGENGLTYTAGDADQLAARIWEFASNHELRARCALTGYCEARQRYAAPVIVDQIERYLQESVRTWRPPDVPKYDASPLNL